MALSLVSLLACGGSPAAVSAAPPAPSAAPKAAAPSGPVEVINLAAKVLVHAGYDSSLLFSKGGMLAFRGPAGFHRVDPTTGVERVLWRSDGTAEYVRYSSERFVLLEATGPFRSILVDLDAATARELPGGAGHFAFSKDETQLLWQPSEGPSTLFDTASLRALHTFPAAVDRRHTNPTLSSDGKYAYVGGSVYASDGTQALWSTRDEPARVRFTTVAERTVLLVSRDKTIELVDPVDGTSHRANADCIDVSHTGRESFGGPRHPWFVRTCPRGLLAIDLAALLRSSAALLPPTRIRHGIEHHVMADGGLAVKVGPAGKGPSNWVLYAAMGKPAKKLSAPPAIASQHTEPTVISSSADGTRRVVQDANGCRLMVGDASRDLGPSCLRTVVSPDGRFVAATAGYGLTVRRLPELTPVFQTDPQGLEEGPARVEGSFHDDEIVVSRPDPLDPTAVPVGFSIVRTAGVPIGGLGAAAPDAGLPADAASETRGDNETDEASDRATEHEELHPYRGEIEGFVLRDEAQAFGPLALWSVASPDGAEPRLMLTLGPDFAIFESPDHQVQVVGHRAHAATWLRCLELDGVLRPFETCAARRSAVLF